MDVLPLHEGGGYAVEFEEVNSPWRQGVWLGTDGVLEIGGMESPSMVLWSDTAPVGTVVTCRSTRTGLLTIYNIWDSGRGYGDHESQRASSGMLREDAADGSFQYRCQDISVEPVFDRLTFRLRPIGDGSNLTVA